MRNREAFRALIGRAPDDSEAAILARLFDEQRALFEAHPDDARKAAGGRRVERATLTLPADGPGGDDRRW